MLRPGLCFVALIGALLPCLSFGQQWNTNAAPVGTLSMPQRVTMQHRADEARRAGVILERQINGIPGDPTRRQVLDRMKGPGPVQDVEFKVVRTIGGQAVAKAIAKALPIVSTVVALKDIADAVRCREGFSGGECDLGTDQVTEGAYRWETAFVEGTFPSAQAAAVAASTRLAGLNYYPPNFGWVAPVAGTGCTAVGGDPLVQDCGTSFVALYGDGSVLGTITAVRRVNGSIQTVTQCPASVDASNPANSIPAGRPPGLDGKCATGRYSPADEVVIQGRIWTYVPPATVVAGLPELVSRGIPVEHDAPGYRVDAPPQAIRDTTEKPDGSVTVRDTSYPWVNHPDGYGWQPRVETREYPPGAEIPPLGNPGQAAPPATIQQGPGAAPAEKITCGLPGTPPCKIDESGTPDPVGPSALDPASDPLEPLRSAIESPVIAQPSFSWAFQLPTACSVIQLGAFAGFDTSFDLCRFQPIIHDLMSIFWLGLGIVAAWSMVTRTLSQ
jgi:hypothetical protein